MYIFIYIYYIYIYIYIYIYYTHVSGPVVKALDFQSKGPVFKTIWWFQGRLNLSSFRG